MKIELVAKQVHKFAGKLRKKGEHFEATPAEARVLKALGRAVEVMPAPPALAPHPQKRAYKRKDLQADTFTSAAAPLLPPAPAPAPVAETVQTWAKVEPVRPVLTLPKAPKE